MANASLTKANRAFGSTKANRAFAANQNNIIVLGIIPGDPI